MLLTYVVLALSVSIDALGIGITYGFRNTKINGFAKLVLFIISVCITGFSVCIGNSISNVFSENFVTFIGSVFLIFMGLFVIYQALKNNKEDFDFDGSQKIDVKEAMYMGIALSIDSICVGICSSVIGYSSYLFPVLVATFQLIFLSCGRIIGQKISSVSNIPENIWNVLSGVLLICIGVSRFFVG